MPLLAPLAGAFAQAPGYQPSAALASKTTDVGRLQQVLQAEPTARVMVTVQSQAPSIPADGSPRAFAEIQAAARAAQDAVIAAHGFTGDRAASVRLHRLENGPYLDLTLGVADLEALAANPLVEKIVPSLTVYHSLDESVPLVGMPTAYGSNATGSGRMVAILDSGVDKGHAFLAGKVTEEACYSAPSAAAATLCPSGSSPQLGPGSGVNCSVAANADCKHGTHVAGIAAGLHTAAGTPSNGVAKAAGIMSVQVFRQPTSGGRLSANSNDINAGLDRVLTRRLQGLPVDAVNLSLGGGTGFTTACDSLDPIATNLINSLKAAGVATVIAAGNSGFTNAISWPSCISAAVSVGSTTKSDALSSFSNNAAMVDLLAPGSSIVSSTPGGIFEIFTGTSMATPHVAGAFAAIRSRAPTATVDVIENALKSTGTPVSDTRTGGTQTKPRMRVDLALQQLPSGTPTLTVSPDVAFASSGLRGGPFSPVSRVYNLTNTGSGTLSWNATSSHPWLSFSPASGSLAQGVTVAVTVSINSNANSLIVGSHSSTATFRNTTNAQGTTLRTATLTVNARPPLLAVAPDVVLAAAGEQGGPFTPSSRVYNLTNAGGGTLSWAASDTQNWLTITPASGTIAAGATTPVTVSINTAANGLIAGSHSGVAMFTNLNNAQGNASRTVTLNIRPRPPVLAVSPNVAFTAAGTQGGPFTPLSRVYNLTNTGGSPMSWTATDNQAWLTVTPASGTLAVGAIAVVTVAINTTANSLRDGTHTATTTFRNVTSGHGTTTRVTTLTVRPRPQLLSVSPDAVLASLGPRGGPFTPTSRVYNLTNAGGGALNWAATSNLPWLTFSPASGTLGAGVTTPVTVSINNIANDLAVGSHVATATFRNLSNSLGTANRTVTLSVRTPPPTLSISPSTTVASSGPQGGAFLPESHVFRLANIGNAPLNWTAGDNQPWLTVSPTLGSLAVGAATNVTVSINTAANALPIAGHVGIVTFVNTTNGLGSASRTLALTVRSPTPVLSVTPSTTIAWSGEFGGPFNASSRVYRLTNIGTGNMNWSASGNPSWLSVTPATGTLLTGGVADVTVSLNTAVAVGLLANTHNGAVSFENLANGQGNASRAASLVVRPRPALGVTPATPLTSSGPPGGPFTPNSQTYQFTNTGGGSLSWTAAANTPWLTISPNSGNIAAGTSSTVTVSIGSNANSLVTNSYNGIATFTATNGTGTTTRSATLTVRPPGPANDDFANAAPISGTSGSLPAPGTNVGATGQSGEPNHANASSPLQSVWYRWTAPDGGLATFNTTGSGFDTTLAAYTGSGVGSLTCKAAADDSGGGLQSSISFATTAGIEYRIAVDGKAGATGAIHLNWSWVPNGVPSLPGPCTNSVP